MTDGIEYIAAPAAAAGASDHGDLTGLADDDHPQYLTTAEGNAAYQPLDSDLTALAALSPSNDDLAQRKAGAWTNRTPAQVKTDLALAKGDVGLGNVDNTSDAGKPVSTATQTALDAKVATTGGGKEAVQAHGATGSTETFDLANGNVHSATLDAACTFTFTAPTNGVACSMTLILTQDATGSRLVTWPASVKWASASAPTLSTGVSKVDVLTFLTVDGGTTWLGFVSGLDLR